MFRTIGFTSLKTNNFIRKFSSNQKIINTINSTTESLPKLSLLELGLKGLISVVGFPFGILTVKPNHIYTYYTFGKYDGYKTSGLNWIPPNSVFNDTFCGDITLNNNNMHLTDSLSNPIRVSSFVIYNVINPVNHYLNLDSKEVLSNWVENITRDVISKYSYNELTSGQKEKLSNELVEKINTDVNAEIYGIEVKRAGILEINYAPEIAETMLVKQKARATIEARKELVDATLNLIEDIGEKLNDKLTQEDKSKLITCLTVSMIGNNSPSQVINLN